MTAAKPNAPSRPRALIIGATAGLGRALAEEFAAAGWDLVLTGRDAADLAALAQDLRLQRGVAIEGIVLRLEDPASNWDLSAIGATGVPLQAVLIPAGMVSVWDDATLPAEAAQELWRVNYLGPTQAIAQILPYVVRDGQGVIVGFGSIAATRGRARNLHYGAAKRALAAYFEGLRQDLQGCGIRVQFYVPGYLDTNLAAGVDTKLPRADPSRFAAVVRRRLSADFGTRYFPFWWLPLCVVLRLLPWSLYRRLRF